MYAADGNDNKSDDAHNHARELAAQAEGHISPIRLCMAGRRAGVQIG